MNMVMTQEEYDALPDRSDPEMRDPRQGETWRDPGYPTLVFVAQCHRYHGRLQGWNAYGWEKL